MMRLFFALSVCLIAFASWAGQNVPESKESSQEELLTLPPVKEGDPAPPSISPPPPAPVLAPVEDAEQPVEQQAQTGENKPSAVSEANPTEGTKPAWKGSLMFEQKRVDDLMAIYKAYLDNKARNQTKTENTQEKVNVNEIIKQTKGELKEQPEEVLKMTLDSIAYYRGNQWSIWINGKGYQDKDAYEGFMVGNSALRLMSLSKYEAVFLWSPVAETRSKLIERWKAKQDQDKTNVSPLLAQDERVAFNQDNGQVTFTLKPNQTFDSLSFSVWEGKTTPGSNLPKQPASPGDPNGTPGVAPGTAPANPAELEYR